MAFDLEKYAEKIAEAARNGVQVERLWSEKLKADRKQKEAEEASDKK